jgi:hypothetical protein
MKQKRKRCKIAVEIFGRYRNYELVSSSDAQTLRTLKNNK